MQTITGEPQGRPTMIRKFIPIAEIDLNTNCHRLKGDDFEVLKDSKSYEEHKKGIDYFSELLKDGVKLMPVLVEENKGYKEKDGFKRILAHKKIGRKFIEAFVYTPDESGKVYNYDGMKLTCKQGGQSYKIFKKPVEYDEAIDQKRGCGKVNYLYVGKTILIELREAIHIHWGRKGRYRLILGWNDFKEICEVFNGKTN